MDRNGRCVNVTSYFPVGKDLEALRAEDRTPQTAGDGHVGSADDGVDVSLIRWMLSLTPTERLQALQSFVDLVATAHK